MKRLHYIGAAILLTGAGVGIAILLVEPMGLFSGSRPADLGFTAGRFRSCPATPNCVSSTAPSDDAMHHIAPLRLVGAPEAGWNTLKNLLASTPRVKIITEHSGYLHAEFTTRTMGFVDDVEFALDAGAQVIHVRSASRLGVSDVGVNRARIESIRERLASG